jgi:hypothetical protein
VLELVARLRDDCPEEAEALSQKWRGIVLESRDRPAQICEAKLVESSSRSA